MSEYPITPDSKDAAVGSAQFNAAGLQQITEDIKSKQSLLLAVVGGLAASIVAAILWGLITYATNFQIGFMAIGVGFLVGYAVRFFGKGITPPFGIVGALFSLLGCVLGNLFMVTLLISHHENISFPTVLFAYLSAPLILVEILKETFSFMDLIFYGIAVYEGYKFSFYQLTPEEIASVQRAQTPPPPPIEAIKRDE